MAEVFGVKRRVDLEQGNGLANNLKILAATTHIEGLLFVRVSTKYSLLAESKDYEIFENERPVDHIEHPIHQALRHSTAIHLEGWLRRIAKPRKHSKFPASAGLSVIPLYEFEKFTTKPVNTR